TRQFGLRGKAFLGESFFTAANPPFGATFTYYLKDEIKTRKQKRLDAEKEAEKKKEPPPHPTRDQLRAEAEEEAATIVVTIRDSAGQVVRTLTGPVGQGFHRVSWDLRQPAPRLPAPRPPEAADDLFFEEPAGPLVMPGVYRVALAKRVGGSVTSLAEPREFRVVVEGSEHVDLAERTALFEFQQKVARLDRAVSAALDAANELNT